MMIEKPVTRSFIAIPLSPPVRAAAATARKRLQTALPKVRWLKPEALHLTLHFFGDLDDESLDKARAVMVSIESLFSPFSMRLERPGAFPSADRARIFWLGIESDGIIELHAALNAALTAAGFPCDNRPFKPHITLGRCRTGAKNAGHILSQGEASIADEMTVDRLVLYQSELLPGGARHTPLETIHFTAD